METVEDVVREFAYADLECVHGKHDWPAYSAAFKKVMRALEPSAFRKFWTVVEYDGDSILAVVEIDRRGTQDTAGVSYPKAASRAKWPSDSDALAPDDLAELQRIGWATSLPLGTQPEEVTRAS